MLKYLASYRNHERGRAGTTNKSESARTFVRNQSVAPNLKLGSQALGDSVDQTKPSGANLTGLFRHICTTGLALLLLPLLFNVETMTKAETMGNTTNGFDFEHFERMKGDQAKIARAFLLERFPINSDAKVALEYVQAGGAKCTFTGDREYKYYFCQYTRVGHGLMALVSSVDWKIILITNDSGSVLQNISVGREISGS